MGKQESSDKRLHSNPASIQNIDESAVLSSTLLHTVGIRRTSYEEVIHRDSLPLGHLNDSCPVTRLASCLAEWLVVLQAVSDDRGPEQPSVSCRCNKANRLSEELQVLGRRLAESGQVAERVGGQLPGGMEDSLREDIARVADILRAEVSILIPSGVGRADPEVSEQARWLLSEGDLPGVLQDTVEALTAIVGVLLGVDDCQHHHGDCRPMDQDVEEEIRSMVASMCGGSSQEEEDRGRSDAIQSRDIMQERGKQVLEKSRKRKQARPSRVMTSLGTSYTVPIDREVGKEDGGQCLAALEKRKKLVKKDGLYKFVLWREALRDSKTQKLS